MPKDDSEQQSPAPGASLAAGCLKFSIVDDDGTVQSFAPVYTHQIFPDEYIPGYRPMQEKTDDNKNQPVTEEPPASLSLDKNDEAQPSPSSQEQQQQLSVHIQLAPSCLECIVSMETRPLSTQQPLDTNKPSTDNTVPTDRPSKRSKLKRDDGSSVELGSEDSDTNTDDDDEEEEATAQFLTLDQIHERLKPHLPPIVETLASDKQYLQQLPTGTILKQYTTKGKEQQFVLTVCRGKDCVEYHNRIQPLARYFIETAEDVDVCKDPQKDDDAWRVMYLFQQYTTSCYALVGYMTLYSFASPFRKPVGGTVLRVCQALLLPPYQRSGHGNRMLRAVFDAHTTIHEHTVEINCEDPAPGFSALRLVVDYERFREQERQSWFPTTATSNNIQHDTFFTPLKEADALEATKVSQTTVRQLEMVYEIDKLQQLKEYNATKNDSNQTASLEKKFRLMVKKRLNIQNREELSACEDKQEMKTKLGIMYDQIEAMYVSILARNTSGTEK